MSKPTGYCIYRGPSLLDGAPIMVIATTKSSNAKTANMVQTWIIREDIDPLAASRTGADFAICGTCPHRGTPHNGDKGQAKGRSCYVALMHAPLNVFKTFHRGRYPDAFGHAAIADIGRGRMVRIGSYGDGAAVPQYVWDSLISEATGHTAYSHQAETPGAAFEPQMYMRSADTLAMAQNAWDKGQRTFRVIGDVDEVSLGNEILCPASEEAGRRTTCDTCGLCAGAGKAAKSIAIVAHGAGARNFVPA